MLSARFSGLQAGWFFGTCLLKQVQCPSQVNKNFSGWTSEERWGMIFLTSIAMARPLEGRTDTCWRLQDVLLNRLDSSCKYDLYIHDLVGLLIMECQLSDGLDLYVKFSKLSLRAGSKSYTLFSEKEGRNSGDIRWILQTSKQKFDTRYKRGDIQLAAALIGACQANYLHTNKLDVKTLYGIKVLGEEFFFCRVDFETDYMKQLLTKAPAIHNVIFYRYPQAGGLRISKPEDRRKLLYFMYRLRKSMLVADCQVQC